MAHVRQSIRDNVVTTLTGLTTTGANVFASRVYPLATAKLPGLAIYTNDEAIEASTIQPPRVQLRTLTLTVEIYARGATADDVVDTACVQIEEALYTDRTRGGNARDTRVVTFSASHTEDGDQPITVGSLSITIDYQTAENDIEAAA